MVGQRRRKGQGSTDNERGTPPPAHSSRVGAAGSVLFSASETGTLCPVASRDLQRLAGNHATASTFGVDGAVTTSERPLRQRLMRRTESNSKPVVQRQLQPDAFNVVGERHDVSDDRRDIEQSFTTRVVGGFYKTESELRVSHGWDERRNLVGGSEHDLPFEQADPAALRMMQSAQFIAIFTHELDVDTSDPDVSRQRLSRLELERRRGYGSLLGEFGQLEYELAVIRRERARDYMQVLERSASTDQTNALAELGTRVVQWTAFVEPLLQEQSLDEFRQAFHALDSYLRRVYTLAAQFYDYSGSHDPEESTIADVGAERSLAMHVAAESYPPEVKGVWKIGSRHVDQIQESVDSPTYNLVTQAEFEREFLANREGKLWRIGANSADINKWNRPARNKLLGGLGIRSTNLRGALNNLGEIDVPIGSDF